MKRWVSTVAAAGLVVAGLVVGGSAQAAGEGNGGGRPGDDRLQRWAEDTWASLDAMTDETTGLPSDNVTADQR